MITTNNPQLSFTINSHIKLGDYVSTGNLKPRNVDYNLISN